VSILPRYIREFRDGRGIAAGDAEIVLDALIGETDEPLLTELFRRWNAKGIYTDEIYEIARVLRDRCTPVRTTNDRFVDIVGTGGAANKTFNVSTAAAFVIAGAGVAVAKHGNKAATSNSGSADVLSALGVEPAVDAATAERCLNEIGMCFMFAPNFHRLSPTLGKVRRTLGFPTIFNCVGPLCNPAHARHQVIGVWDDGILAKMADALSRLGTGRSWVVHGRDGMDEISLAGSTSVAEIERGSVTRFEMSPRDFGFEDVASPQLKVASADESASLIRSVLDGRFRDTAAEKIVLANAAAAIYIADEAKSLADGLEAATESIRSGNAKEKLLRLAELTSR
jgi:anthranilate phosphoribosyltransferase